MVIAGAKNECAVYEVVQSPFMFFVMPFSSKVKELLN